MRFFRAKGAPYVKSSRHPVRSAPICGVCLSISLAKCHGLEGVGSIHTTICNSYPELLATSFPTASDYPDRTACTSGLQGNQHHRYVHRHPSFTRSLYTITHTDLSTIPPARINQPNIQPLPHSSRPPQLTSYLTPSNSISQCTSKFSVNKNGNAPTCQPPNSGRSIHHTLAEQPVRFRSLGLVLKIYSVGSG